MAEDKVALKKMVESLKKLRRIQEAAREEAAEAKG